MKYLFTTIGLCLFIIITRAQKINPYLLSDRQADSLHAVLAHTTNDSVKMELNAIFSMHYCENDMDSAIYFLNAELALARKLDIPLWKAEALSYLVSRYSATGNYAKSLEVHHEALQIANDKASDRNKYLPKFITDIPDWFTSRECLLSIIHSNTALLYDYTGDHDKALDSHLEALHAAEKSGDRESLPIYYANLSGNCRSRYKLDSAFMLIKKAIAMSEGIKWQYYTSTFYMSLGDMYKYDRHDTAAGLYSFRLAASISHQQQNFPSEAFAYIGIAVVFRERHQPDSVIAYCRKVKEALSRCKDAIHTEYMYNALMEAYQMKGNMDSAFAYQLLDTQINDSLVEANVEQMRQYQTLSFNEQLRNQEAEAERSRQQARMITCITLAGFAIVFLIAFLLYRNNRQRQKTNKALTVVRDLQERKISQLDEAVTKRTEQLNSFRQVMATDFHDQTGNMLSAISRQAMMLKLKLNGNGAEVLPMVESIITNSNDLYDSSKDFLWNLNNNSDDPLEVFQYLASYGQVYYNQFSIPFSSRVKGEVQPLQQLDSFAALNLIYIFKEAMTNVVKHADASEVVFEMEYSHSKVMYALQDNGTWKPKDEATSHYGLNNMERRCEKNKFGFLLSRQNEGTRIEISVPVTIDFIA